MTCPTCNATDWLASVRAAFLRRVRVELHDLPAGEHWLHNDAERLRLLGFEPEEAARDAVMACADPIIRAMLA